MATRANVLNRRIARIGLIALTAVFADDPLRVRCVAESRGMLSPYPYPRIRIRVGECDDYQGRVFAERMAASARGAADGGPARHHRVAWRDVQGDDRDVEGLRRGPCPA